MSEPRTQAGRNLLSNHWLTNPYGEAREGMRHAILAVETEALPSVERLAAALHLEAQRGDSECIHLSDGKSEWAECEEKAAFVLAALRDEPEAKR